MKVAFGRYRTKAIKLADLPETGFLRLPQIIGDRYANPPIPARIPVSKSTWWAGIKTGRYPAPIKLGPRITAWRVEDIRKLIEQGAF
jgi:prophage regulatory protein